MAKGSVILNLFKTYYKEILQKFVADCFSGSSIIYTATLK